MLLRSLLLTIVMFVVLINVYAQQVNINKLSPQTYDFVKHGNVPVSHFTGESNYKIPLYTYGDNDFEIPIYLGYNSSGFIPGKREGIVGLNWFLNAGGAITRRVNGEPDEKQGKKEELAFAVLNGLYYGIKNNLGVTSATKAQVYNMSTGAVNYNQLWHIDGCEVYPDDFMFNMPGMNGRFFLENNGLVKTIGNKPYKVDLTGFGIQPSYETQDVNNSEIIITGDNGYTYYFGGGIQYLEVSYSLFLNQASKPVITAWHLRKIEAPNGRTVTYVYKEFVEGFFADKHANDPHHYLLSTYEVEYSKEESTCNDFAGGICSFVGKASGMLPIKELTKTVYLEKVIVGDVTIELSHGEKEKAFYPNETGYNQKTLRVNSMQVKVAGNPTPLKQFKFGYTYLGGSYGERQFLTSLNEVGLPPFTFTYYKTNEIPDPKTKGLDHWGFWNGGYNTLGPLIPNMTYQANGDAQINSGLRDANPAKADVGLLRFINYPTGGSTEFIYESNYYSKRLERRNASNFIPQLFDVTGLCGGARVHKIIDSDGINITNTREFKYLKSFPSGTQSSGILLSWPRYVFYWKYDNGYTVQHVLQLQSNSFNVNYYPGESFIQYGEVSEILTPSNGYINYRFTNYESHPDFNEYKTLVIVPDYQNHVTNINLYNSYVGIKLNDRSFERGLPQEVTWFASKGAGYFPVKKTITQYQKMSDNPENYVAAVHGTGALSQSFKAYYYPVNPLQEQEITYANEGTSSSTNVTNYAYNNTNYLLSEQRTRSDGRIESSKYKYPLDFITDADALLFDGPSAKYLALSPELKALVDLKKNNIVNQPVEVIKYINGAAVNAQLSFFKDFSNSNFSKKVYPHKQWVLHASSPVGSFVEASITKGSNWTFNKNIGYEPVPDATFDRYDEVGNLLEWTDKALLKSSYKWSSNKLYPIAEGTGMAYDEYFHTSFEDSEGNSDLDNCKTGRKSSVGRYSRSITGLSPGSHILSYWQKQTDNSWKLIESAVTVAGTSYNITLTSQIDDLRLYPNRVGAKLQTYTFETGVGMTSNTNFNNNIQYYGYDATSRLKKIEDTNRFILKLFDYNFKVQ